MSAQHTAFRPTAHPADGPAVDRGIRRTLAIGAAVGIAAGLIGVLVAGAGPVIAVGGVLGVLAAVYVLTNTTAALIGVLAVMALIPFGTFPFRIGFTPTLIDAAMGAFILVYALEWMTGRRRNLRITPVHGLIALYLGWLVLSFVLGLRFASPTSTIARQFAGTLLAIGLTFVLVDFIRTPGTLRRVLAVLAVLAAAQALTGLGLYALNDQAAERTLIRLARIGYPDGGVIRYIEDNPAEPERAIGLWVDPNAYGGFLTVCAALFAPQLFDRAPLFRSRAVRWAVFGVLGLALVLTFSRASMLGFAAALTAIGLVSGYRRFLPMLGAGLLLFLVLPQTQGYVERFVQAFTGADLATQMRIGEYGDALELIARYPITGVGFTGTPEIDLYTDVASMYLIMANQIGLVGVFVFASVIIGVFAYAAGAWRQARAMPELFGLYLGAHAALVAALINATADLYFFRLDFQASITLFWLLIALALTTSRLARERTGALAQG
jgi:hypothetical protein